MQSEQNNIDHLVKESFTALEPDLTRQSHHWKQMEAMLEPGIKPMITGAFKKTGLVAAVIMGSLLTLFILWKNTKLAKLNQVAQKPIPELQATPSILNKEKAIEKEIFVKTTVVKNIPPRHEQADFAKFARPEPFTIHFIECDTPVINTENKTPEAGLSISSFYDKISKPAQEFEVDMDKGASLVCQEGTQILIPAAAFTNMQGGRVSGKAIILVEEYYKYSDMIAANLTTMSNGKQLVTGGMVKLTAMQGNQELKLKEEKRINLSMPTKEYDEAMELFLSEELKRNGNMLNVTEFLKAPAEQGSTRNGYNRRLNWQTANIGRPEAFDGKTSFLNLDDDPVRVRESKKRRVGIFHITSELPMSATEAKTILKEKHGGYYDVIKVKKVKPWRKDLIGRGRTQRKYIGDSTKLTVQQAIKWHYIERKDSAFYAQKTTADSIRFVRAQQFGNRLLVDLNGGFSDTLSYIRKLDTLAKSYAMKIRIGQAYQFSLPRMGWINCDRFYNYPDKTDFVISLPQGVDAGKFVTQLVFTNIRSVIGGQSYKDQIGFLNVPKDLPVFLVGLGEKDGKVVSFMQRLTISSGGASITKFEETTPEAFREKLKELDL